VSLAGRAVAGPVADQSAAVPLSLADRATREETRSLFDLVMKMERQIRRLQSDVGTLRGE
jgi:hypothetical protein